MILNNKLNDWAAQYNVSVEAQAGFRNYLFTIANILITQCLNNYEHLNCVLNDFTKVFDFVDRDTCNLWYKLLKVWVGLRCYTS